MENKEKNTFSNSDNRGELTNSLRHELRLRVLKERDSLIHLTGAKIKDSTQRDCVSRHYLNKQGFHRFGECDWMRICQKSIISFNS